MHGIYAQIGHHRVRTTLHYTCQYRALTKNPPCTRKRARCDVKK